MLTNNEASFLDWSWQKFELLPNRLSSLTFSLKTVKWVIIDDSSKWWSSLKWYRRVPQQLVRVFQFAPADWACWLFPLPALFRLPWIPLIRFDFSFSIFYQKINILPLLRLVKRQAVVRQMGNLNLMLGNILMQIRYDTLHESWHQIEGFSLKLIQIQRTNAFILALTLWLSI